MHNPCLYQTSIIFFLNSDWRLNYLVSCFHKNWEKFKALSVPAFALLCLSQHCWDWHFRWALGLRRKLFFFFSGLVNINSSPSLTIVLMGCLTMFSVYVLVNFVKFIGWFWIQQLSVSLFFLKRRVFVSVMGLEGSLSNRYSPSGTEMCKLRTQ